MIFSVVGGRFPYSFKWHPNITETGLSIFKYEEIYQVLQKVIKKNKKSMFLFKKLS